MKIIIGLIGSLLMVLGGVLALLPAVRRNGKGSIVKLGAMILAGFFVLIFSQSFEIVPTGYTGVRSRFGLISEKPMEYGFNWKVPFVDHVELVNNKQQDKTYTDQVWSESSDQTVVYAQGITISYSVDPSRSTWIYANVSDYDSNLISENLVSSAFKTASRQVETASVTDRGVIEPKVRETMQEAVDEKYGKDTVHIINVVINQIDFEDSYNEAIAKRQQALVDQEYEAIQNQTAIAKAKAEADAVRERAQGAADAEKIQAEAKAEANKTIADSIDVRTVLQDIIESWNGELPKYVGSDAGNAVMGILDGFETEDNNSGTSPAPFSGVGASSQTSDTEMK